LVLAALGHDGPLSLKHQLTDGSVPGLLGVGCALSLLVERRLVRRDRRSRFLNEPPWRAVR
jgi:hypothetical protein